MVRACGAGRIRRDRWFGWTWCRANGPGAYDDCLDPRAGTRPHGAGSGRTNCGSFCFDPTGNPRGLVPGTGYCCPSVNGSPAVGDATDFAITDAGFTISDRYQLVTGSGWRGRRWWTCVVDLDSDRDRGRSCDYSSCDNYRCNKTSDCDCSGCLRVSHCGDRAFDQNGDFAPPGSRC